MPEYGILGVQRLQQVTWKGSTQTAAGAWRKPKCLNCCSKGKLLVTTRLQAMLGSQLVCKSNQLLAHAWAPNQRWHLSRSRWDFLPFQHYGRVVFRTVPHVLLKLREEIELCWQSRFAHLGKFGKKVQQGESPQDMTPGLERHQSPCLFGKAARQTEQIHLQKQPEHVKKVWTLRISGL